MSIEMYGLMQIVHCLVVQGLYRRSNLLHKQFVSKITNRYATPTFHLSVRKRICKTIFYANVVF